MTNAHNLNIPLGRNSSAVVQDVLADALRRTLLSAGWAEAGDHEPAERTVILSQLGGDPWLTILDDAAPEDREALAGQLSERIGSPVISLLVHDGQTYNLALYRAGRCADELRLPFDADERTFPLDGNPEAWAPLLAPGATIEQFREALSGDTLDPLGDIADLLVLRMPRQVEIDGVDEDDYPELTRLRLISAEERAKQRRRQSRTGTRPAQARRSAPPAPEPSPEAKQIPELLIGKPAEVKRRLKAVIKRAAETMDWSKALAGVEHVAIDDVGSFLSSPPLDPHDPLRHGLLYLVGEVMVEVVDDRDSRTQLMLDGMSRPWFCMAMLAWSVKFREDRGTACAVLKKVLRWWPDLFRWDERTDMSDRPYRDESASPHKRMLIPILRWCEQLGPDWEREIKPLFDREPEDIAFQILEWIHKAERRPPDDLSDT